MWACGPHVATLATQVLMKTLNPTRHSVSDETLKAYAPPSPFTLQLQLQLQQPDVPPLAPTAVPPPSTTTAA